MSPQETQRMLDAHGAKLRPKSESKLMKAIDVFLRAVSFGQMRSFMDYWTTIGHTIYWPDSRIAHPLSFGITLEHECVHIAQWDKWHILYALSYLLFPLPAGLAWFRWRWEREAYLVQIRHARNREREIEWIVESLWRGYLWPWPRKRMRKWFLTQAASMPGTGA